MPGFIKTKSDEHKWQAIKHSVAKERGKGEKDFTDRDWATVNAAWHKSEIEEIKKSISIPSATKMPKSKVMPDPFGKPSKFFKNEGKIHPNLQALQNFLTQRVMKSST